MLTLENEKIIKYLKEDKQKLVPIAVENKLTGNVVKYAEGSEEFVISYQYKRHNCFLRCSQFTLQNFKDDIFVFYIKQNNIEWIVKLFYDCKNAQNVIKKHLEIQTNTPVFINYIDLENLYLGTAKQFTWSVPNIKEQITVSPYITTLGQPVYFGAFFGGAEFPTAENTIVGDTISEKYYLGRHIVKYTTVTNVIGASTKQDLLTTRKCFFDYIYSFSRPVKFRIQFNSWYDNMLDIDENNIKNSFLQVAEGFKNAGYRNLDTYVVDDGWVDYKADEFWGFKKDKFPDKFKNIASLTQELGATFGVWFGPRGGYSEAFGYARRLKKLGYNVCKQSADICTGTPKYIDDLTDKMIDFMKEYNVDYFKLDGFANRPCKNKKHNHLVGGDNGIYFYTELWENWTKSFEKMRQVNSNVFLNITSYAHCSPWFLKWCDAIWINNASDMGFEGEGSNLDQCLNYRDGRYYNFTHVRQLQFPVSYIYNHEPCYAERNYNPPLPSSSHKTVTYTDIEFEQYLYMCMMRGTGFVEIYFSPSLMTPEKWKIASEVFTWAEANFDIIKHSTFFGVLPKSKGIYGYYAVNATTKKAIMIARNSSDVPETYMLKNEELSHISGNYLFGEFYPNLSAPCAFKTSNTIALKPKEIKIFTIDIE
ncbi:MAG: hypothetical protein RR123_00350 [Clostridia bacterium]